MRIVFFGHHKVASRFFRNIFFKQVAQLENFNIIGYNTFLKNPLYFEKASDLDLKTIQLEEFKDNCILNLSNSGKNISGLVRNKFNFKGLHVIRDPRQIWVSNYFHHLSGHSIHTLGKNSPWFWTKLKKDRPILESLSLKDGLLYELENITADIFLDQLIPYVFDNRVFEIKLEEIIDDPRNSFINICEFLNVKKPFNIENIFIKNQFKNPNSKSFHDLFNEMPVLKKEFEKKYYNLLTKFHYK